MEIVKLKIGYESYPDYARENGYHYSDLDIYDMLESFSNDLKKYGLEVLKLDYDECIFWKVAPKTLMDATKYYVERGIKIG